MKISTKGQYAVRLMVEIAKCEGYVPISTIAKNQELSVKYLEQIVSLLVKHNLLESERGHKGGYKLTKSPSEYSIKEILETTGDITGVVPCVKGDCKRRHICSTAGVWATLSTLIGNYLAGVSLQDLIDNNI